MAALTEEMKEVFRKMGTFVFATSDRDGNPNAVPVNAVKVLDDETIVVSDQFFNKTLENLQANPRIAMSFWKGVKGWQIKGDARLVTEGPVYEETAAWIDDIAKQVDKPLKSKGAVVIKITEIYSVTPGPGAGDRVA
ncbi:MAG: pyridoxamine 5'-phosphate oxidase family protein [Desulfatibacillaceae bacterium]